MAEGYQQHKIGHNRHQYTDTAVLRQKV